MSIPMPSAVLKFPGQVVSEVVFGAPSNQLIFTCRRDKRRKVFDPETGQSGTINRYVRPRIKDIPLMQFMDEIRRAPGSCNFGHRSCAVWITRRYWKDTIQLMGLQLEFNY